MKLSWKCCVQNFLRILKFCQPIVSPSSIFNSQPIMYFSVCDYLTINRKGIIFTPIWLIVKWVKTTRRPQFDSNRTQ